MKKMLFLILILPCLTFATFFDEVQKSLQSDANYLSAKLNYGEADFQIKKDKMVLVPYVGLENFNLSASISDGDVTYSTSIPVSITFSNIAGFNFSIRSSWTYQSSLEEWKDSGWTFSVSRKLFSNFDLDQLEKQKDFFDASWKLLSAKNNVFLSVANDIFNSFYYTKKLDITSKKLRLLNEQVEELRRAYEVGSAAFEDIVSAQKQLQNLALQLERLGQAKSGVSKNYPQIVLDTMMARLRQMTSKLPGERDALETIRTRYDVQASFIALEIAKRQSERAYQTWLPNPTFTAGVSFKEEKNFSVSLGFAFSYNLMDRGEKSHSYKLTQQKFNLQQIVYEEKLQSLEKTVKDSYASIRIAEISKDLAELDLELKKMNLDRLSKKKDFVSPRDLETATLDVEEAELELFKADFDLLMSKLNLFVVLGVDLIEVSGGV